MTIKETEARDKLLVQGQREWLNPKEVQKLYGFSTSSLAKNRMNRINLPFSKFGKYIRYKRSDIEEFLESNRVEVTL